MSASSAPGGASEREPEEAWVDFAENESPAELSGVVNLVEHEAPLDLRGTAHLGDAQRRRQRHRLWIALVLMGFVGGGSVAVFLGAFYASAASWDRVERAAEIVLVPLLTLLGAAVGWYFSEKSHE